MAKKLLDCADVVTSFEQVVGEAVAKRLATWPFAELGGFGARVGRWFGAGDRGCRSRRLLSGWRYRRVAGAAIATATIRRQSCIFG